MGLCLYTEKGAMQYFFGTLLKRKCKKSWTSVSAKQQRTFFVWHIKVNVFGVTCNKHWRRLTFRKSGPTLCCCCCCTLACWLVTAWKVEVWPLLKNAIVLYLFWKQFDQLCSHTQLFYINLLTNDSTFAFLQYHKKLIFNFSLHTCFVGQMLTIKKRRLIGRKKVGSLNRLSVHKVNDKRKRLWVGWG